MDSITLYFGKFISSQKGSSHSNNAQSPNSKVQLKHIPNPLFTSIKKTGE